MEKKNEEEKYNMQQKSCPEGQFLERKQTCFQKEIKGTGHKIDLFLWTLWLAFDFSSKANKMLM